MSGPLRGPTPGPAPAAALEAAAAAARAGGRVLMDTRRGFEVAEKKGRADLVTSADVGSQQAVVEVLRAAFPEHAVVGEEGSVGPVGSVGPERSVGRAGGPPTWYVDPLDGTTNYVHGLAFFGVSVALRHDGRTVCGVVYDPLHEECYEATTGGGAWCNGERLSVSSTARLDRALVCAMAQSSDRRVIAEFARLYETVMSKAQGVRHLGAPSLVLCAVASGRLDAYVERDMAPWDILAGALAVEEAGGRVGAFDGSPGTSVEPFDVVASNGAIHAELVAALAETGAATRITTKGASP
ncbi:MAG: inositol monophosphatase [Acidimicrobiales bacterium]|nr:inositol monophosphatase [Acidimicrobiales bacterium]